MHNTTQRFRKILLIAASVTLVAVAAGYLLVREPTYKGKSFSFWFAGTPKPGTFVNREETYRAMKFMGPRAVPYLIQELKGEEPVWRSYYRDKWPTLPANLKTALPTPAPLPNQKGKAAEYLGVIGPPSQAAIPPILELIKATHRELLTNPAYVSIPAQPMPRGAIRVPPPINCRPIAIIPPSLQPGMGGPNNRIPAGPRVSSASPAPTPALTPAQRGLANLIARQNAEALITTCFRALGNIGGSDTNVIPLVFEFARSNQTRGNFHYVLQSTNLLPALHVAFPLLKQSLQDTNRAVRELALIGIGMLIRTKAEAAQLLTKHFSSESDLSIKLSVVRNLGQVESGFDAVVPFLVSLLADPAPYYYAEIAHIFYLLPRNAGAVPALIAATRQTNLILQANATWSLGYLGFKAKEAVPALTDLLQSENRTVKCNAAVALWLIDRQTAPVLPFRIEELKANIDGTRWDAVKFLGEMGSGAVSAVPDLMEVLLHDSSNRIRGKAAIALGQIGPAAKAAVPALAAALKDEFSNVRDEAAAALKLVDPENPAIAGTAP